MVVGCPVFNFVTATMGRGNPDFGDHNTLGVHFSARPGIDYGSPEQSGATSMWPRASETVGSHFVLLSSPGRLRSVRGVGFLAYKRFIL